MDGSQKGYIDTIHYPVPTPFSHSVFISSGTKGEIP